MKRMISLTALIICSFTISFGATQTWRLTNDAYKDTLPKIVFDNAGNVWVAWLSNTQLVYRKYETNVWSGSETITTDGIAHNIFSLVNDRFNNKIWATYDSEGYVLSKTYTGNWSPPFYISDDAYLNTFSWHRALFSCADTIGNVHFLWCALVPNFFHQAIFLRSYHNAVRDTIEKITTSNTTIDLHYLFDAIAVPSQRPLVLDSNESYTQDWRTQATRIYQYKLNNFWSTSTVVYFFVVSEGLYYGEHNKPIGLRFIDGQNALVAYTTGGLGTGQDSLWCKKYNLITGLFDTAYSVQIGQYVHSGAFSKTGRATIAWSNSHGIYLNEYGDTAWSASPVRISDTLLQNCINPDIEIRNDSTIWVCYQNDGDIYITMLGEPDSIPPAAITTLNAILPTCLTITLQWTAVGDDSVLGRANSYDIRYSTAVISDSTWGSATNVTGEPTPQQSGLLEHYIVTGLEPGTKYYFAIKVADRVSNISELSNVASSTTSLDTTAPAATTTLCDSLITATTVVLKWIAVGDDGLVGQASTYDLRYSTTFIDSSCWTNANIVVGLKSPHVSGALESFLVTDLIPNTSYYFGLKAADEVYNVSGLSNIISCKTPAVPDTTTSPTGIVSTLQDDFKVWPNPASQFITIYCCLGQNQPAMAFVYNIYGEQVKKLYINGPTTSGSLINDAGKPLSTGVYFIRLQSGGRAVIKRISIIK